MAMGVCDQSPARRRRALGSPAVPPGIGRQGRRSAGRGRYRVADLWRRRAAAMPRPGGRPRMAPVAGADWRGFHRTDRARRHSGAGAAFRPDDLAI